VYRDAITTGWRATRKRTSNQACHVTAPLLR
jgi:hypothetical protein